MRTGEQKGRQEGMILGALMSGKTPEEVAEMLNLPLEEIKKVQEEQGNWKKFIVRYRFKGQKSDIDFLTFFTCVTVKIPPLLYRGGEKIFRYKYELLCYHRSGSAKLQIK